MSSRHSNTHDTLDFQEKLKILHDLNAELSRCASFDDLCRRAVELGRQRLGFDRLSLWFFDTDPYYILGTFGTDEDGQTRDERGIRLKPTFDDALLTAFERRETRAFRRDVLLTDHRAVPVGRGENAVGILWDGERRLGWLSADNFIHQAHITDYQVELLGLYGTSLGHLVTRKRTEEELRTQEEAARNFQAQLRTLHEVTIELSKMRSFDDLCRRAVELGHQRLGFDRLGLWFFDSDPNYLVGSFGIDESGNLRDERGKRIPTTFGNMVEALDGRVLASAGQDTPLFDDQQNVVGYGWNAAAKVWDGDRTIGWLSVDNLLTGRPRTDYILELASLYAATLGHLATIRKSEDVFAAERTLFRAVVDTVPDLIFAKDAEGRFIMVNRATWEDTPGARSEYDLIGKTDYDILPLDLATRYVTDDRKVINSGQPITNIEEPGRSKDDTPRYLLTTKLPLRDVHGNVIGLVGLARDITSLRQAEQQATELVLALERVRILKEFMTNISHDFRTPLSVIKSSLYLLERMSDPLQRQARLDAIKRQVTLLDRFVEEIMTSARVEKQDEISAQAINMDDLIASIEERLRPAAEDKAVSLTAESIDGLPTVLGDETDLNRAFSNLIQNAIYYTPPGGSVAVRIRVHERKVIIEIQDTGIGISESDLPRIFDHFYRVDKARAMDKSGMGLGLAITKRIIEIHNGTIEVESILGNGSLFRILLPLYTPEA